MGQELFLQPFAYKVMASEETTASGNNLINIGISTSDGNDMASVLQMLLVLTVISLAPSILIMLTSFTRIVIVLHFTRAALGTQTVPPNQVIIGLSLFLTFFVMSPVFTEVYDSALKPLSNNEISVEEAYETGVTNKIVWKLADKIQQLCKGCTLDFHRHMLSVENDAVFIVIHIR